MDWSASPLLFFQKSETVVSAVFVTVTCRSQG
jgi:hypothetical protein